MPPRPDSMPPPPLGAGGGAAAHAKSQISRHGKCARCLATLRSVLPRCEARQVALSHRWPDYWNCDSSPLLCNTQPTKRAPHQQRCMQALLLKRSTGRCASGRAQWCGAGGGAAECAWRGGGDGAARGMARGAGRADAPAHARTRVRTSRRSVMESSGAPGNQALHKHPTTKQLRAGTGHCGIW